MVLRFSICVQSVAKLFARSICAGCGGSEQVLSYFHTTNGWRVVTSLYEDRERVIYQVLREHHQGQFWSRALINIYISMSGRLV